MKLTSIKIEKLFDLFDYEIDLDNPENVVIITGPNGFGKTMILNIIYNLFNKDFAFFHDLKFEKIELELDSKIKIIIHKTLIKQIFNLNIKFYQNDLEIDNFKLIKEEKYDFLSNNLEHNKKESIEIKKSISNEILNSINIHFIKEQRLFKQIEIHENNFYGVQKTVIVNTIESHSEELIKIIAKIIQDSFVNTQKIDNTYIDRLIDEKNIISENDYNKRLHKINEIQSKLIEFGLFNTLQKNRDYSEVDAKALLVFIKDLENKLSVFEELLQKLTLFTSILNERRFTYKSVKISKEKGFYFTTSKGEDLKLNQLSSGEQNEVVLLYELIFNTTTNLLLLIDEPEISLHITWQKEFLNDILKIAKIQNIQVIIATHAPAIVNGRWDLTLNLAEIAVL